MLDALLTFPEAQALLDVLGQYAAGILTVTTPAGLVATSTPPPY